MAGDKYQTFSVADNKKKLIAGVQSSAGAGDAGKIPALDTDGKLDITMIPDNIGQDVEVMPCSENLAAGDFVNIYDDTGTRKCRLANATDATKPANGFVLAGFTSGANATVYLSGKNNVLSGLTINTDYFLSKSTPGGYTTTLTGYTTTGNQIQNLGKAVEVDTIVFEFDQPIEVA